MTWHDGGRDHTVGARFVLAERRAVGAGHPARRARGPGGRSRRGPSRKINFLLDRLPEPALGPRPRGRLRGDPAPRRGVQPAGDGVRPGRGGPGAVDAARRGLLPLLTDPSILGASGEGRHTLTYFGLHTPTSLFDADPGAAKAAAVTRAIAALNAHLVEPIETCVARDAHGNPCIEAKIPQEIEADLAMPGGHIFHGDLEWPWAPNRSRLETPPSSGASRRTWTPYCCAAPARVAAARSRASAATAPPRRSSRRCRQTAGPPPIFPEVPTLVSFFSLHRAPLAHLAEQLTLISGFGVQVPDGVQIQPPASGNAGQGFSFARVHPPQGVIGSRSRLLVRGVGSRPAPSASRIPHRLRRERDRRRPLQVGGDHGETRTPRPHPGVGSRKRARAARATNCRARGPVRRRRACPRRTRGAAAR